MFLVNSLNFLMYLYRRSNNILKISNIIRLENIMQICWVMNKCIFCSMTIILYIFVYSTQPRNIA